MKRSALQIFFVAPPNRTAINPTKLAITMTTVIMIVTADIMITVVAGCVVMGKYVNAFSYSKKKSNCIAKASSKKV